MFWQHFSYLPHIAENEEKNLKKSTANFVERRR
jgi:hypothetical protein